MTAHIAALRLVGTRVVLREFRDDDVEAVHRIIGDPRVTDWLSFEAVRMIADVADRAQLEPRTEYYLGVTPFRSDHVVGFARLGLTGVRAGKLGYAMALDEQGQGYATDAVRTLLGFGFLQLALHRVSAAIGPTNTASIAVVTKLGFTCEGRIRDHVHTNGAWRDSLLYSLLADEWTAGQRPSATAPL
jgi:RimJ/RimL family protein N-acetyltransferase